MSLTLLQAETAVRALTRHDNDTRVEQTQIRVWLHQEYRKLRTWLQDVAPGLYLVCSGEIEVGPGDSIQESSASATFEKLHRVEWDAGEGNWRPLERADALMVNSHKGGVFTFREEGGCIKFGPDRQFSGSVRVFFHASPPDLTADADLFNLPVQLEQPLILRTCGWVAVRDGDGGATKKAFDDMAEASMKEATPLLKKRHGIHPARAGLHRVMGY